MHFQYDANSSSTFILMTLMTDHCRSHCRCFREVQNNSGQSNGGSLEGAGSAAWY